MYIEVSITSIILQFTYCFLCLWMIMNIQLFIGELKQILLYLFYISSKIYKIFILLYD